MTTLVIDASVALKWVIPEELSDVARQIVLMPGPLVAPRLIMTELANALARKTARRLDAQLITADRRFATKLAGTDLAPHVTLLSDWRPE